jgi:hypothetical protein
VLGQGELVARQGGQRVAVARRHSHAPLAIERQRCGPLKDDSRHFAPPNPTELHFIAEIGGFTVAALEKSIKSTTYGQILKVAGSKIRFKIGTCERL